MSLADDLTKLDALRQSGALTEHEFRRAKSRLLGEGGDYGTPVNTPAPVPLADGNVLRRFTRSGTDKALGGVCGGLGRRGPIPSWLYRVLFVMGTALWGFGLLLYVALWLFVPGEDDPEAD